GLNHRPPTRSLPRSRTSRRLRPSERAQRANQCDSLRLQRSRRRRRTMKVILRADVTDVGHKGDVLDVADGYARNYLVPRGLAMAAAKGALAQAESMRRARAVRDARDREAAEEIATKLTPLTIKIRARAGAEGRLFGSVTPADVAAAVEAQAGFEVDRRRLHLD